MAVCQTAHQQLFHRYRGRRASGGSYIFRSVQASCDRFTPLWRPNGVRPINTIAANLRSR